MISRLAMVAICLVSIVSCGNNQDVGESVGTPTSIEHDRGPIVIGPQLQVDLAIYLVAGASDSDLTDLIDAVLARPLSDGRPGSENLPGIEAVIGDYGRKAAYLNFSPSATASERQTVIDAAVESSLVDSVLEDIVPDDQP